jgi:hypothetical protein
VSYIFSWGNQNSTSINKKQERDMSGNKLVLLVLISLMLVACASNSYKGERLDGKRHGQGVQSFASGSQYVGEFKNGQYNGQGTFTFADGGTYIGEWANDKFHGVGTRIYPDGKKYVGEWANNKFHGMGTLTYSSGKIKYDGEYKSHERHGQGSYTFPDGGTYIGEWANDKFHGMGTRTYSFGYIKVGIWANNNFTEYYTENRKEIEADNTELIVDSFIKYFWKKPVGAPLQNTQISIVDAFRARTVGNLKKLNMLSKGKYLRSPDCTVIFRGGGAHGVLKKTDNKLIFFNSAATRTLNGRNADNYQYAAGKYPKDAAGEYIRDAAGNCLPIPETGPGKMASGHDTYIPSRTAQAIHYTLKQKGVDLGHCVVRRSLDLITDLEKLNVVDCYLEDHGFTKKQSAVIENIYPTVSIATYGNNFLGIWVFDATYGDNDVGKTREEIYAEYRSDPLKQKEFSNYLKQYISRTQAKKKALSAAYFQHLDALPNAPHFTTFTPEDVSNVEVVDKGVGTDRRFTKKMRFWRIINGIAAKQPAMKKHTNIYLVNMLPSGIEMVGASAISVPTKPSSYLIFLPRGI